MTVANCFVDLIDIQGSSVLVCFEDGWDATAQVSVQSLWFCVSQYCVSILLWENYNEGQRCCETSVK